MVGGTNFRGLYAGNFPKGNKFIRRIYDLRFMIYEFFFTVAAEIVKREYIRISF